MGRAGNGLPFCKVITNVIAPVAFRGMVPALGYQFINLVKDTSLLVVIGVAGLTRAGQEIMTENHRAVELWFLVAVIHLIIPSVLGWSLRRVELRITIAWASSSSRMSLKTLGISLS